MRFQKIIVSVVLFLSTISLFAGRPVFGAKESRDLSGMTKEELKQVAGTLPSSKLYGFDLGIEQLYRLYATIRGAETSVNYLKKSLRERQAEIRLSNIEPTSLPDNKIGYPDAWKDMADIYADIFGKIWQEQNRLKLLRGNGTEADRAYLAKLRRYEVGDGKFEDIYLDTGKALYNIHRESFDKTKDRIRPELAEASRAEKTAALLDELMVAKEKFAARSSVGSRYATAMELEKERAMNDFDPIEKAQALIEEVKATKKRLAYEIDYLRDRGVDERKLNAIDLTPLDRISAKAQKYLDGRQSSGTVISDPELWGPSLREIKVFARASDDKIEKISAELDEKQKTRAEKDAEKIALEKQKQGQAVQKPKLPPIGEPAGTAAPRLVFVVSQTNFTAKVGKSFSHSFCEPALNSMSDLCTAAATNPKHGLPPYSFVLQTGAGFPPFGLSLNKNGLLAGMPTAEGSRTFGVCAIDQGGFNVCRTITINVAPKEEPPPPEPEKDLPPPPSPTQPPVRKPTCFETFNACLPTCQNLPSYPTYEKEACLTTCNTNYSNCRD